jgi:hypothetical protein
MLRKKNPATHGGTPGCQNKGERRSKTCRFMQLVCERLYFLKFHVQGKGGLFFSDLFFALSPPPLLFLSWGVLCLRVLPVPFLFGFPSSLLPPLLFFLNASWPAPLFLPTSLPPSALFCPSFFWPLPVLFRICLRKLQNKNKDD